MSIRLFFLGTSSATPQKTRFQSCYAVRWESSLIILDMGEGAQYNIVDMKVGIGKPTFILISHLHSDHVLGIPGFLATRNLWNIKTPVVIAGPRGVIDHVTKALEIYKITPGFSIEIRECVTAGTVERNEKFIIDTTPVKHRGPALAFRIKEKEKRPKVDMNIVDKLGLSIQELKKICKGENVVVNGKTIVPEQILTIKAQEKSIVYSGDTQFSEELEQFAHKATILIHEATLREDEKHMEEEYGHSTPSTALNIAEKAQVKSLYLSHISPRHTDLRKTVKDLEENTDIPITIAEDGMVVDVR